ncbi:hypothetical protein SADUNF_Sadunf10G0136700 [Salix dunnii]|uniref:Phosphoglycolate phosphatase n=1 Tax=Salix dunnii TaxID=1413687 RepID=A0A835JW46_9ROSI|nr:hypothetical protein SADUNF_Sadunf10G0136700 [Salix dunnii]
MLSRTVVSVSAVSSSSSTSPSRFLCKVNPPIPKFLGLKGLSHNFTNCTTWNKNLNLNRRCNTRMENFTTKASASEAAQPLKNADELIDSVETFIFDCDGVIWKGDKLIDGVPQTLDMLRSRGKRLVFVTNNSTKSRKQYGKKFETLGLDVSEEEIFASSFAAAAYLKSIDFPKDKKVYVVGEDGILKELELAGFQYLGGPDDGGKKIELKPGFLMEHDKDVNFSSFFLFLFNRAFRESQLEQDIPRLGQLLLDLIAISTTTRSGQLDCQFQMKTVAPEDSYTLGLLKSYISAMSKLIELPVILPNIKFLKVQQYANVVNKFGILKSQICMVGDRLDTDILFGQNGGCKTLLVLSGVTSLSMLQSPSNSIQPDFYTNKISDFLSLKAAAV